MNILASSVFSNNSNKSFNLGKPILLFFMYCYFSVILAPYGLNGTLTGQAYRDMDPNSRRVYQEWVQYYPLEMDDAKEFDPNRLPNLVEVLVGE